MLFESSLEQIFLRNVLCILQSASHITFSSCVTTAFQFADGNALGTFVIKIPHIKYRFIL